MDKIQDEWRLAEHMPKKLENKREMKFELVHQKQLDDESDTDRFCRPWESETLRFFIWKKTLLSCLKSFIFLVLSFLFGYKTPGISTASTMSIIPFTKSSTVNNSSEIAIQALKGTLGHTLETVKARQFSSIKDLIQSISSLPQDMHYPYMSTKTDDYC